MQKMKVLVKKTGSPGILLKESPVPEYGNNDLLIRIKKAAIC